jgi:hypothetical protein
MKDDDQGEEDDGYDEALCPLDYPTSGMIRDDDLFDILVKPMADGVHMVSLVSSQQYRNGRCGVSSYPDDFSPI